ncbi:MULTISPECIES: hypothetical protein [Clostridium]|uniref:hypothetical protein n=1 Tax=Clostridium TaxID=1485 RepID=UPI0008266712|nr:MULTISPECIES: hypothetical protein [Clostridium]PJI08316.1 hypothetical protein CUB90_10765 [Clostridium sp. CT7]
MLKIELELLFGDVLDNKEIWYCHDERTNKFYKRTIAKIDDDVTEIIDEVSEEQVENYMYQNKDKLLKIMNIQ